MSAVTNVWRQLVQRRLWPVAIILIAALAAVPLTLAQEPETPAPLPVANADGGEDVLASQPIVAMESAAESTTRERVLGDKKNPFAVVKPPKAEKAPPAPTVVQSGSDAGDKGAGGNSSLPSAPTGGGVTPGVGPSPVDPTPAPTPRTYDKYDLTVRFGDSSGELDRLTLKRLQPLPKAELPALIYLGVSQDGKSAIFLLEKGVESVGDGDCTPAPDKCETVSLRAGETEFIDVIDEDGNVSAQYQLDLVKIHRSETASATAAAASSKAGKLLLADRAETDGPAPFRFDAATGTLTRRPGVVGDVARTTAALR